MLSYKGEVVLSLKYQSGDTLRSKKKSKNCKGVLQVSMRGYTDSGWNIVLFGEGYTDSGWNIVLFDQGVYRFWLEYCPVW